MTDASARRQVVKFSFYRVDPAWRALPPDDREHHKDGFCAVIDEFADRLQVRSYTAVGLRGDVDFLLWQIAERLDDVQALASALLGTSMGPYLSMPHSYLAMTRRSVYVTPVEAARRDRLHPAESRYLFVYPFVKTREWYQLPLEERQAMMDQHIAVGRKYPSVKLNTTYSFGLDDQEFVVAFETDEPADFLDLVMELREARSSMFTLRDTPTFTSIAMPIRQTLDALGSAAAALAPGAGGNGSTLWERVADTQQLPAGSSRAVYHRGEQVALFNSGGRVYAVSNRCSHANGPLADGDVDGRSVTCPYHGSCFDLETGRPIDGPATRPLRCYDVEVRDGGIYLARRERAGDVASGAATG